MNTSKNRFKLGLASLAVMLVGVGFSPNTVTSTGDPVAAIPSSYRDYQDFPMCANASDTFCISSWGLDSDGDGSFELPNPNLNVSFHAWIWDISAKLPGLAYELRTNGQQENISAVPSGTAVQFAINTGEFKPSPSLYTQAEVLSFSQTNIDGKWITAGTVKTAGYSFATECYAENKCAAPRNRIDFQSHFQGVQFYEEPNPLLDAKTGNWVSTNATETYGIEFDQKTLTWTVQIMGPATKMDGSPNVLRYATFIPDSFIQYAYGTTADLLTTSLTTTRIDGELTTTVASTITRVTAPIPGILIYMPNIPLSGSPVSSASVNKSAGRYSTTPKLNIKPKVGLLQAPQIRRATRINSQSIRVTGTKVSGAEKYQAMCSRGLITKAAYAKQPSVKVGQLTKGKWKCSIRGVKRIGGRWSKSMTVTIR